MDNTRRWIFTFIMCFIILLGIGLVIDNIHFSKRFILNGIEDKTNILAELNKYIIQEKISDIFRDLNKITNNFHLDIDFSEFNNKSYMLKMQNVLDKKFSVLLDNQNIKAILIINKQGNCVYSSVLRDKLLNMNLSFRRYFQDIVIHRKDSSIYLLYGVVTKKIGFFLSHKIIDKNGDIGVVVVKIYPKMLKNILEIKYDHKVISKLSAIATEDGILFTDIDTKAYVLVNISKDLAQKIKKHRIVDINTISYLGFPENTWSRLKKNSFLEVYNPKFDRRYILVLKQLPFNKYYLFMIEKNMLFKSFNRFQLGSIGALFLYSLMLICIIFLYLYLDKEATRYKQLYNRYNEIVNQSKNIIISIDVDGNIKFINPYAKNYIFISKAIKAEDIFGRDIKKLMQDNKSSITIEREFESEEGDKVWINFTLTPIMDPQKNILEWIGIGFDITQKKKIEEELRKASEAKSTFLSIMSHEIRTPMNAIVGMAELLCKSKDIGEEEKRLAQGIYNSSEILLKILNDLLDISKIEAGKMELEQHPFLLHDMLKKNIYIFKQISIEKKLKFYCYLDPKVPFMVIGDSTKLGQIIRNLLSNAFKFTSQGFVKICCTLEKIDGKTAWLLFTVQDTGIGIPRDRIKDIFNVFTQSDSSIKRKYGGTGLGLALCKEFATIMGGDMWVESTENKGSTFFVKLPFEIKEMEDAHFLKSLSWFKNKTIILLDSDPISREGLKMQFSSFGIETIEVSSEKELFSYLEKENPREDGTIIIIDEENENILSNELLKPYKIILQKYNPLEFKNIYDNVKIVETPICKYTLQEFYDFFTKKNLQEKENKDKKEDIEKVSAKILVVEDNPMNQLLISSMFQKYKKYKIDIKVANNGLEALNILEKEDFDVILMDIQMPVLDGVTTTTAIRTLEKGQKQSLPEDVLNLLAPSSVEKLIERLKGKYMPIIAITANVFEHEKKMYLEAGMDDFLPKPFKLIQLENILKKYIGTGKEGIQ